MLNTIDSAYFTLQIVQMDNNLGKMHTCEITLAVHNRNFISVYLVKCNSITEHWMENSFD